MKGFKLGVAALAALVYGCGGSSGGGGGSVSGSATEATFGKITTRAFTNAQPVTVNSSVSASVGLVGTISEMNYRDTSNSLDETYLAYTRGRGSIYVSAPDGSDEFDQQTKNLFDDVRRTIWHPDGKRLFVVASPLNSSAYNLYSIVPFAPGTSTLIQSNVGDADISPLGTGIVYTATVSGYAQVFVASITGASDLQLTTDASSKLNVCWPREEFVVFSEGTSLESIAADGSGATFGGLGSGSAYSSLRASNDGRWIGAVQSGGFKYFPVREDGFFEFSDDFGTPPASIRSHVIAPDNKSVIWALEGGLYMNTVRNDGAYKFFDLATEEPVPSALDWQPFGTSTLLVGNGGRYGSAATGFIYTQRLSGDGQFGSLVLFTAQTPSSARMSAEVSNASSPYLTYVVEMDKITQLRMTTGRTLIFSTIIGSAGNANGAVVSINAQTGRVATVIPYAASRAGTPKVTSSPTGVKVEGEMLGVYDGSGKNLADRGAARVEIDASGIRVD